MKKVWIAAALAASFAAPVLSATPAPAQGFGGQGQRQTTFRSEDAKKIDAEIDLQYKRRHDFGAGQTAETAKDPWGDVRSPSSASKPDVKPSAKKAAR